MTDTTTTTNTWQLHTSDQVRSVTITTASHRGDQPRNADAVDVHHYATAGTAAAVVVDGRGTSEETAAAMQLCAGTAVRIGGRRGALNGLLTAGALVADPGVEFAPVDGVAALAVVRPGAPVAVVHVGRCRAWAWDGVRLVQLTEDLTAGQLLRNHGAAEALATAEDRYQRVTLARCTVGTVPTTTTEDPVVMLTSDGVHSVLGHEGLAAVLRAHAAAGSPVVAEHLMAAALDQAAAGERDNASAVVIEIR
jgi:serine/threonine protein phosphatase PrpC